MVVVSEPLRELVGEGRNAKYVKDCVELFLGNRRIEKIRDFEKLVNLEVLWLNGNRLRYLNNLDSNFRITELYAQDNQICTLKGSLLKMTFLKHLDLSNNQLRDLSKLLSTLEQMRFVTHLNLSGNPCCEEPDYRLIIIERMPWVKVLDQHVIQPQERRQAAAFIGGDVGTLTVAFGKRALGRDEEVMRRVPERSHHEVRAGQEAAAVRARNEADAAAAEERAFSHDPNPVPLAVDDAIPPPPGWEGTPLAETYTERKAALEHERCPPEDPPPAPPPKRALDVLQASLVGTVRTGRQTRLGRTGRPDSRESASEMGKTTMRFEGKEYRRFVHQKDQRQPWKLETRPVAL